MPLFHTDYTDPTFLFGVSTLFSVVFVQGDPANMSLVFRDVSEIPTTFLMYILDPAFLVGLVILIVANHFVGDKLKKNLTSAEKRRAGWYLWNAVIFHTMMVSRYNKDKEYSTRRLCYSVDDYILLLLSCLQKKPILT